MAIEPKSPDELASALAEAANQQRSIRLVGRGTKDGMGGPLAAAGAEITTRALNRLLKYEPRDLTISVEAGMRWKDLNALLERNGQMIPLDPPFSGEATVGGVIATNSSGPRRRLYGTARDMVIGMSFATLEGKVVETGGMVVKNVAGLDMGKLMIGSFGTLAAVTSVNFRVYPRPPATRTFRWSFSTSAAALIRRDSILRGVLQPMAVDLRKSADGFVLMLEAGGSAAILDRYSRELSGAEILEERSAQEAWREMRQFTPFWLLRHPEGAVARVSTVLSEVGNVMDSLPAPAIARAGNGVCYGYFTAAEQASEWFAAHREARGVIEYAPRDFRERGELWWGPGQDFSIMQKIKSLFDSGNLLNRGRLYGRL
ncbi:MAG TPA: FAD-binding oxidoreductase [Bryobacteraceae bacterium]|nr:FAD-binding oxidoreductase [Bryobacteraceae bacterium]